MMIFFENKKLSIAISSKTVRFDSSIEINKSIGNQIKSIKSHNESLAEYTIKNNVTQLFFKYGHENDIPEHKRSQQTFVGLKDVFNTSSG